MSLCTTLIYGQSDLRIQARFVSEEHSDDSNTQAETFDLENNRLRYTWVYSGYYPGPLPAPRNETQKIDSEKIRAFIKERKLNSDRNVVLRSDKFYAREIHLFIRIEMGGVKSQLKFDGLRPDDGVQKDFEDALELLSLLRIPSK